MLAVVFMVLAVCFKQMAFYFALPFAFFTLGKIIHEFSYPNYPTFSSTIVQLGKRISLLILVFLVSLFIIFYPITVKTGLIEGFTLVSERIFPIRRGIFEDKVASFWCVLHNFYKVNTLWPREKQVLITSVVTLSLSLVSCFRLVSRPITENFIMSLYIVSLTFFLFSFQVHEK